MVLMVFLEEVKASLEYLYMYSELLENNNEFYVAQHTLVIYSDNSYSGVLVQYCLKGVSDI